MIQVLNPPFGPVYTLNSPYHLKRKALGISPEEKGEEFSLSLPCSLASFLPPFLLFSLPPSLLPPFPATYTYTHMYIYVSVQGFAFYVKTNIPF